MLRIARQHFSTTPEAIYTANSPTERTKTSKIWLWKAHVETQNRQALNDFVSPPLGMCVCSDLSSFSPFVCAQMNHEHWFGLYKYILVSRWIPRCGVCGEWGWTVPWAQRKRKREISFLQMWSESHIWMRATGRNVWNSMHVCVPGKSQVVADVCTVHTSYLLPHVLI